MKLSYRLIKISSILTIFTLFFSIILTFYCQETKLLNYINNIVLNIFAGTIVLLITSIVEYFSNRRKILETLMKLIIKYNKVFSDIKYLDKVNLLNCEEYERKFNKKKNNSMKNSFINECNEYNKNLLTNFDEIMNQYINISKMNFNDFWDIYEDLHFIFNNKKIKIKLHSEIFQYVYDEIRLIRELVYYINEYNNSNMKLISIYDKIRNYQKHIFSEKHTKSTQELEEADIELIKNGFMYSVVSNKNETIIIYNKMSKYLIHQLDVVGKRVYFNKNYEYLHKETKKESRGKKNENNN